MATSYDMHILRKLKERDPTRTIEDAREVEQSLQRGEEKSPVPITNYGSSDLYARRGGGPVPDWVTNQQYGTGVNRGWGTRNQDPRLTPSGRQDVHYTPGETTPFAGVSGQQRGTLGNASTWARMGLRDKPSLAAHRAWTDRKQDYGSKSIYARAGDIQHGRMRLGLDPYTMHESRMTYVERMRDPQRRGLMMVSGGRRMGESWAAAQLRYTQNLARWYTGVAGEAKGRPGEAGKGERWIERRMAEGKTILGPWAVGHRGRPAGTGVDITSGASVAQNLRFRKLGRPEWISREAPGLTVKVVGRQGPRVATQYDRRNLVQWARKGQKDLRNAALKEQKYGRTATRSTPDVRGLTGYGQAGYGIQGPRTRRGVQAAPRPQQHQRQNRGVAGVRRISGR